MDRAVLRALILSALALLGTADAERRFENPVYGHTVLVPAGWTARLGPDGTTNVVTYRNARLDRLGQPPAEHVRLILLDYGRLACPRDAFADGTPIRLGPPVSFEGFVGRTVSFCRGGHSLQALIPVGRAAPIGRLEDARRIVESFRLTRRAGEVANVHSSRVLGRSDDGRPIRAWRIGNPGAPSRMLVVGCIHGNECAGTAVTQQLVNLARPVALDLWVIQNLNPDGLARGTRGNARGVDLNRDFTMFSQRETRIARDLIRRIRPDVTVWFHQPQALVRGWGLSRASARRYARLAGARYRSLEWPPGSASRWQNGLGQTSFVVELPPGKLPLATALRHARAILRYETP